MSSMEPFSLQNESKLSKPKAKPEVKQNPKPAPSLFRKEKVRLCLESGSHLHTVSWRTEKMGESFESMFFLLLRLLFVGLFCLLFVVFLT